VTEHREYPRKNLTSPVAFQLGEGPRVEAECHDVSLGGMYIETAEPLPYGTAVRVFLRLPGLAQEARIESIVRWWKPTGMGVQFGVMGARETHALTTMLSGGGG
jgi:type IV pilus assembly protein PilZ